MRWYSRLREQQGNKGQWSWHSAPVERDPQWGSIRKNIQLWKYLSIKTGNSERQRNTHPCRLSRPNWTKSCWALGAGPALIKQLNQSQNAFQPPARSLPGLTTWTPVTICLQQVHLHICRTRGVEKCSKTKLAWSYFQLTQGEWSRNFWHTHFWAWPALLWADSSSLQRWSRRAPKRSYTTPPAAAELQDVLKSWDYLKNHSQEGQTTTESNKEQWTDYSSPL